MPPTSFPWLEDMKNFPWLEDLKKTTGPDHLREGRYDLVPLAELKKLTNTLVAQLKLTPQTDACDARLLKEILKVKGEWGVHETAIVACLHVLTDEFARGQVISLRPETEHVAFNPQFEWELKTYLQCIILGHEIKELVFEEHENHIARVLLSIVSAPLSHRHRWLWTLMGRLSMGHGVWDELFPHDLIKISLRRSGFSRGFAFKLQELQEGQRWDEAYDLMDGVEIASQDERLVGIVNDVIPQYAMWACWKPDRKRIKRWGNENMAEHRGDLGPLLELEGPDTTGQQGSTLKEFSPGYFTDLVPKGPRYGNIIIERTMTDLDKAVRLGPYSVDLLVKLCIGSRSLDETKLKKLEAALELGQDLHCKALGDYIREMELGTTSKVGHLSAAIATALPVIGMSGRLQMFFGEHFDLIRRGPDALADSQLRFVQSIHRRDPDRTTAFQIQALGRALLQASWLHNDNRWKPGYFKMLRAMPSYFAVDGMFQTLKNSDRGQVQGCINYLAETLGGLRPKPTTATTPPPPPPPSTASLAAMSAAAYRDPIWDADLGGSLSHNLLRERIIDIKDLPGPTKTQCIIQFRQERSDEAIRSLASVLMEITDQTCVNLAKFLAGRPSGPFVDECWRVLLLHIMRLQSPGLLERHAQGLSPESWRSWIRSTDKVLGKRYLDPEGGMGITKEGIIRLGRGMVLSRSGSTSTSASGGSTGSDSMWA